MNLVLCVAAAVTGAAASSDLDDWIRVAEARRLAEAVAEDVWPGWGATDFPVLLVREESEHLVGFPRTPDGFEEEGWSAVLDAQLLVRPRQFEANLLATFPAFGLPPTVVIGTAEATGKSSTEWVVTLLHEHFHQLQMSDPAYVEEVGALDLAGDDTSGMWMLRYPFPYESPPVADAFAELSRRLAALVREPSARDRRAFRREYEAFLESLDERDRRYLSFQLWQEGVSRYVELRVAESAAESFEPSVEFRALADFEPFDIVAARVRAGILRDLDHADLAGSRRVAFYAFGAGLALVLEQEGEDWKRRYLTEKFFLEAYAGGD